MEKQLEGISALRSQICSRGAWIKESIGCRTDEIEGVGIFSSEVVQKDELLMTIPFSLCLSVEMVTRNPLILIQYL